MVISVLMPERTLSEVLDLVAKLPTERIEPIKITVPTEVPAFQIKSHRDEWKKLIEDNPAWGVKKSAHYLLEIEYMHGCIEMIVTGLCSIRQRKTNLLCEEKR